MHGIRGTLTGGKQWGTRVVDDCYKHLIYPNICPSRMGVGFYLLRDVPWAALRVSLPYLCFGYLCRTGPPAQQPVHSKSIRKGKGADLDADTPGPSCSKAATGAAAKHLLDERPSSDDDEELEGRSNKAIATALEHAQPQQQQPQTQPAPLAAVGRGQPAAEEGLQRVLALRARLCKARCSYKSPSTSHRVVLKLAGVKPCDLGAHDLVAGLQQLLAAAG